MRRADIAKNAYPVIEIERFRAGMTQDELSDTLGFERKSYYNWQKNGRLPVKALIALADLFGVTTDYLLGRSS